MTPELLFEYTFAIIAGIGASVICVVVLACWLGLDFWNKEQYEEEEEK